MPATYEPIATTTLGSAAASITFSSIPATYTDLKIVIKVIASSGGVTVFLKFNSDSGTNYSNTRLFADGTSVYSFRNSNGSDGVSLESSDVIANQPALCIGDIFSYTGSTYKTVLGEAINDQNGAGLLQRTIGLWRSTSAITSLQVLTTLNTFATGTTATLYGIKNA